MQSEPGLINNKEQLLDRIRNIHFEGYRLCNQSFGEYFPNAGNVGVFSRDDEYNQLLKIQENLVEPSDEPDRKYFKLLEPIIIPEYNDVPETAYTHLYIRKPDPTPYGQHSGDIDFYVDKDRYLELIKKVKEGIISNAELYEQSGIGTMIELSNDNIGAIACVSTKHMTEQVRFRQ